MRVHLHPPTCPLPLERKGIPTRPILTTTTPLPLRLAGLLVHDAPYTVNLPLAPPHPQRLYPSLLGFPIHSMNRNLSLLTTVLPLSILPPVHPCRRRFQHSAKIKTVAEVKPHMHLSELVVPLQAGHRLQSLQTPSSVVASCRQMAWFPSIWGQMWYVHRMSKRRCPILTLACRLRTSFGLSGGH